MFRYMAVAWDTSSEQQSAAAELVRHRLAVSSSQWHEVFRCRGSQVFCTGAGHGSMDYMTLAQGSGVVLGLLFDRNPDPEDDTPPQRKTASTLNSERIAHSHGRALISTHWGNYVAFLFDSAAHTIRVIKDPTGFLPCFVTSFQGVTIIFSCIADCVALQLLTFTVNRRYLEDRAIIEGNHKEREALNEVSRIYGGECITIDPHRHRIHREFYWTPVSFEGVETPLENADKAARAMRGTIRTCTHALAGCHQNVLTKLSGGLDSSIITGCLRDAPTNTVCYTYFNPRGRSSELSWAQLAARHCELAHVVCPTNAAQIDLSVLLDMLPATQPMVGLHYVQRMVIERQLAVERGATAVFSGDGGDSGFGSYSLRHAVTDYLIRHGVRLEAFRLASRIAVSRGLTTTNVLVNALREWLIGPQLKDRRALAQESCILISSSLRRRASATDEPALHPWFNTPDSVAIDTVLRLGAIPYSSNYYYGHDLNASVPDEIAPLYAQPVIETLLRIPLYVHCEGGRDRGLARRAFVKEVPEPILHRLWKDRAPGFYRELVQNNRDLLRELLIDGILVQEGMLDREAVEDALSAAPKNLRVYPGEILAHLDTELWASSWSGRMPHPAAT